MFHFVCFSFSPFVLFLNLATRPRASQPSIPYKAAKRNLQTFRYVIVTHYSTPRNPCSPRNQVQASYMTHKTYLCLNASRPTSSSHSVTPNPHYAPNIPNALYCSKCDSLLLHIPTLSSYWKNSNSSIQQPPPLAHNKRHIDQKIRIED